MRARDILTIENARKVRELAHEACPKGYGRRERQAFVDGYLACGLFVIEQLAESLFGRAPVECPICGRTDDHDHPPWPESHGERRGGDS